MRKPSFYTSFLADLVLYAALFILHRAFTFTSLNAGLLSGVRQWAGFFVGALSDIWIAGLFSLLSAGIYQPLRAATSEFWAPKLRALWFLAVALLLASHQSYVEFFGFTMMASHLRYLYDSAFIAANGGSIFAWPLLVYLGLWLLLILWQSRGKGAVSRYDGRIFIAALVCLVILHKRNIHWRVQWFIPENLQMNVVEKLYEQLHHAKAIDPVLPEERQRLSRLLGLPETVHDFPALLTVAHQGAELAPDPMDRQLREAWNAAVAAKRKPVLAVLLMESMRPAETGYFAPGTVSLTPRIDQLAQSAIVFTNAYSSGSVTRGGQESVFCGHTSSRDTSMMRFDAVAPIRCLPEVLGSQATAFWYHGGNGLFDNQSSFWRKHGINELLTQDEFAESASHTSWGVGDISFLQRSAAQLQKLQQKSQADALIGMLLMVSNHIPWDLPADIVPWSLPLASSHPSYRTTAYADHAIGSFVERLKSQGMWDDMLLILVSDHGNLLPPYQNLYTDNATQAARLQSHVNFIISGGLVEKLENKGVKHEHLVSQVDISQFIASITGATSFLSMGENPFQTTRRLPVLSRLEQHLFDPATGYLMDPSAWQSRPVINDQERDLLFYRAYLDYISTK